MRVAFSPWFSLTLHSGKPAEYLLRGIIVEYFMVIFNIFLCILNVFFAILTGAHAVRCFRKNDAVWCTLYTLVCVFNILACYMLISTF